MESKYSKSHIEKLLHMLVYLQYMPVLLLLQLIPCQKTRDYCQTVQKSTEMNAFIVDALDMCPMLLSI